MGGANVGECGCGGVRQGEARADGLVGVWIQSLVFSERPPIH